MSVKTLVTLVWGGVALTASCQEQGPQEGDKLAVSVTVASSTGSFTMAVGDSISLSASTNVVGAYTATWVSENLKVVSVDPRGVTRGVSPGTARVVVRLDFPNTHPVYGSAPITVVP